MDRYWMVRLLSSWIITGLVFLAWGYKRMFNLNAERSLKMILFICGRSGASAPRDAPAPYDGRYDAVREHCGRASLHRSGNKRRHYKVVFASLELSCNKAWRFCSGFEHDPARHPALCSHSWPRLLWPAAAGQPAGDHASPARSGSQV